MPLPGSCLFMFSFSPLSLFTILYYLRYFMKHIISSFLFFLGLSSSPSTWRADSRSMTICSLISSCSIRVLFSLLIVISFDFDYLPSRSAPTPTSLAAAVTMDHRVPLFLLLAILCSGFTGCISTHTLFIH